MGAGLAGLDGLDAGAAVTAEQMRLLFGSGHHPLATERLEALGPDATEAQRRAAVRLGTPFKVYSPTEDVTLFRREVARRFEEHNVAAGLPRDHPIDIDDRARIRTEVARSLFRAEHGRDPANAREISATIAKHSRPRTSAVAGYDLTFTPAKSVSALWAVAPPTIRHQIEAAHDDAVADALAYLERNALFTRTGSNGVRQVDVRGAIATGVRPPRLPRRRPEPAHPPGGGQQGPDPGRAVAVDRRAGPVRGRGERVGDLQHAPGAAPDRPGGAGVHRPGEQRPAQAADA